MTADRSRFEPAGDGEYWSMLAEFIDRRDRGEQLDPAEFAGGDPILTKRLQECLAGFGWLEHALSGTSGDAAPSEPPMPESIGDYNIIRELGRGGMGVVYEAVHQGLGRRVALKVLFDPSLRGSTARERFLREARTAASLHHTNIVPVFDFGTADGHLYFAMQLIEGGSLEGTVGDPAGGGPSASSASDARPANLDPLRVARIGLQAAEALAYAHAHGVIHRDIKPSNLLLDSSGTLWVADFGLSRRPSDTSVTVTGARVGTPRYMSPEQATAQWDATDARTDIYSLGVTLYELLTGRPLYAPGTPPQLLFQIIRTEPAPLRRIKPRVPRDLETIVMKAMAKRPADRYASAVELAADLRRLLADEPVRARRIGPAGRFVRWCRREPLVAAVSALSLAVLAVVVGAYQVRLTQQRDAAVEAAGDARLKLADALFERARAVRATSETGRRWLALDLLKQSTAIQSRSELSVEAIRTLQLFDARHIRDLKDMGRPVTAVAIDDAGRVAAGAADRSGSAVAVWEPGSQAVTQRLATAAPVNFIAFSSDSRQLAATTERHVYLWNLESGALQVFPGRRSALSSVAFSTDGSRLFGFADGFCVWDVTSGQRQATLVDGPIEIGQVVVSCGGRILAATIATNEQAPVQIRRWSLPDLLPLDPILMTDLRPDPLAEAMGVLSMAASRRGNAIAASCGDSRIRLWDAETARPVRVLEGHRIPAVSLAFSSRGDSLMSCDGFELKLWDVRSGEELATLIRSNSSDAGLVTALALGPNGTIATAGDECRLWESAAPTFQHILHRETHRVRSLASSADGKWLVWMTASHIRVWDRSDNELQCELPLALRGEPSLALTPDSQYIAAAGTGTNRLQIMEMATAKVVADWIAEPASAVAANTNGKEIAVAHTDGVIRMWNLISGKVTASYVGHVGPVSSLAFSPDGGLIAAANQDTSESHDRTLHVWDASTGRLIRSWTGHGSVSFGVAFSPGGERLASCGGDRLVRVWRSSDGELLLTLAGHSQPPTSVAFNFDGSLLASCSLDGHVLLWDTESGTLLADLTSRACASLSTVTFSTDGRWVFAAGGPYRWTHAAPGAVEAWDLLEIQREMSQLGISWSPPRLHR
jgi:WD40 repeat protein/tRNA A-37 threonylcarbamoyl transferase component Bud32